MVCDHVNPADQNDDDQVEDYELVLPCARCGYNVVQGDQCGNCGKAN